VMLAWQNMAGLGADDSVGGLALGDLTLTPVPVDTHTARMDLSFSLAERWTATGEPAGIEGSVEFRTDVFDTATIETLIARWVRVLEVMTADPDVRLSSVDVVDGGERARLDLWSNREVLVSPV
ncbi:condensation domain-containing protein, partial [Mycobacterium montefiorense]|uniref:condensation domain-containing protein n=1 Tax=Mycobacterium montefiorense TaxID=154654 RepID=UPI0021C37E49